MTAYRHAVALYRDCSVKVGGNGWAMCGCTDARPDPESPCGYDWCRHRGAYWWHTALRVGGDHDQWDRLHPHVATRCLNCGHAVTA